jgi:hypothetical protein
MNDSERIARLETALIRVTESVARAAFGKQLLEISEIAEIRAEAERLARQTEAK